MQRPGSLETIFTGYDHLEEQAEISLLLVNGEVRETAGEGDSVEIFLDRTPFYAEAGGQVGDSGVVEAKEGRAIIARAFFTPAGQIVHEGKVQSGCLSTGDCVTARVERIRRRGICRSHTATHLLHRALKETLGEHVNQAGSLVSSDRLRFDFTHFKALSPEEKRRIEETVNRMVLENLPVTAERMTLSEAQQRGAVALFTEKYDRDTVRVISAGAYSKELCGGTHVNATGEIGFFRLIYGRGDRLGNAPHRGAHGDGSLPPRRRRRLSARRSRSSPEGFSGAAAAESRGAARREPGSGTLQPAVKREAASVIRSRSSSPGWKQSKGSMCSAPRSALKILMNCGG
jgi:alanyl-tRNA synthetase